MVDEALGAAGWTLRDLDAIAFGAGPGSFTGVRIACSVAQGLALGVGLPLLPVPSLEALAQDAFRERAAENVITCLDARMREVYVAAYVRQGDAWSEAMPPAVLPPAAVALPMQAGEKQWAGAGNGFAAYPSLATQLALAGLHVDVRPTAQSVGELAVPQLLAGKGVAAGDALPLYVRHRVALTTAERDAGVRL
jgi:tRNA threonylcarbamoyladenosine biosynthesis protein TsaB